MPYPFFNAFAIAFLIATTLMLVLRPIAFALRLVDVPGGRKTHAGEVPVIGGVAMFMAVCASVFVGRRWWLRNGGPAVASALTVLVGALDDRYDLPAYSRILAHIAAGVTLILASGYTVDSLGDLLGVGAIDLGSLNYIFTIVAAIALINGFNMLDGLDGLAGSVALIALAGLAVCFIRAEQTYAAVVALSLCGLDSGIPDLQFSCQFQSLRARVHGRCRQHNAGFCACRHLVDGRFNLMQPRSRQWWSSGSCRFRSWKC